MLSSVSATLLNLGGEKMYNPRGAKVSICGLQGSGKTYHAVQMVIKNNMKVLVYTPHKHDFEKLPDNFYMYDNFSTRAEDIEKFLAYAKELCLKGVIDGVFMDEFDMYYKNNFEVGDVATDVFANHRHYKMCIIMITRRPQDIPTVVFESSKFIVAYTLQGENARKKFNGLYKGMGDQITELEYESWTYMFKEIGKPPVKMERI